MNEKLLPEDDRNYKAKTFGLYAGMIIFVLMIVAAGIAVYLRSDTNEPKQFVAENAEKDLRIKGNKNSKIYHLPGCPNYDDIAERNIIWFKTKEEAEKSGFRMAKNC